MGGRIICRHWVDTHFTLRSIKTGYPFHFCDIFVRRHPILLFWGRNIPEGICKKRMHIFRWICSHWVVWKPVTILRHTCYTAQRQIYTVSQKKTSPFLFSWHICQISSDFANFWQKHTPKNLKEAHVHGPHHILLYVFILYLVKTGDASEQTLWCRPLPIPLVIEPESCNFFKSLFKLLTF